MIRLAFQVAAEFAVLVGLLFGIPAAIVAFAAMGDLL